MALSDKELDGLLALATPAEMPEGFQERLIRDIWALPQHKRHLAGGIGPWSAGWAACAAALLLAFVTGYYTGQAGPDEDGLYAIDYTIDATDDVESL